MDKSSYMSSLASMMGVIKWCNGRNLSESLGLGTLWKEVKNAS
jgi:hypothetical protein